MREALFFDSMLTPKIITFVYWLGLVVVTLAGLRAMFEGTFAAFVGGLVMIVVGVVAVRIWCELLIVMFKIYESLRTLVDRPLADRPDL